jgi:glycosyltransferase involved in cell wall biosynthesis
MGAAELGGGNSAVAPLLVFPPAELNVAIASLALGGAERIVLQWAARAATRHRVRIVVLRDSPHEWPVPREVSLLRLAGGDLAARLAHAGALLASGRSRIVLCHLLRREERDALARGGALPIPVLHNARAGWIEPVDRIAGAHWILAVSSAAAKELRQACANARCAVVRPIPARRLPDANARSHWRERWALPVDALVIGMIGGVKPQKAYTRALKVLAAIREHRDAYLVIVGGPAGQDGMLAWQALLRQAERLGIEPYLRLPGFIREASRCLPAFDAFLNTSRYEGLSVATLEALAAGLPVIASNVGGQGELPAPGLQLLEFDAPEARWAETVLAAAARETTPPPWLGFPAERIWTLAQLSEPLEPRDGVVFVTANLNAGGAQRSLTNLALALAGRMRFEIAVCGPSSSELSRARCSPRACGCTAPPSRATASIMPSRCCGWSRRSSRRWCASGTSIPR